MFNDVIGLERGLVVLAPHSEKWKLAFEQEKDVLQALLGEYIQDVHHIGSTSMPGLLAKPIIDILVSLHRFSDMEILQEKLRDAGYEYRENGSTEIRLLFVKGPEEKRTHHIHFTEHQSVEWQKAFAFWNYLQAHPEAVKEYEALKQKLAQKHAADRDQYSKGKADFIKNIIKKTLSSF